MEPFRMNKASDMLITERRFGRDQNRLLVIDNFFENISAVRQYALSQDFNKAVNPAYPGVAALVQKDLRHLLDFFLKVLDVPPQKAELYSFFGSVHAQSTWDRQRVAPHIDPYAFGGLCYLNLPDDCSGGTAFFRHKTTGIERSDLVDGLTSLKREADRRGYLSEKSFRAWLRDADWEQNWELIEFAEMKPNRLILFPGAAFHSSVIDEGNFQEQVVASRLTHNLFINLPEINVYSQLAAAQ